MQAENKRSRAKMRSNCSALIPDWEEVMPPGVLLMARKVVKPLSGAGAEGACSYLSKGSSLLIPPFSPKQSCSRYFR